MKPPSKRKKKLLARKPTNQSASSQCHGRVHWAYEPLFQRGFSHIARSYKIPSVVVIDQHVRVFPGTVGLFPDTKPSHFFDSLASQIFRFPPPPPPFFFFFLFFFAY